MAAQTARCRRPSLSMEDLVEIMKEKKFEGNQADEANLVLSYALDNVAEDTFSGKPRKTTLIHAAVLAGCDAPNFCKILSLSPPSHLTRGDASGNTPLHLAAREGESNNMTYIIMRMNELSHTTDSAQTAEKIEAAFARRNKAGRTPLFEAVESRHFGCVSIAMQHISNDSLWKMKDKTGKLVIERLDNAEGGQAAALCQRLLLRLNNIDHFFDGDGVSLLHRVLHRWSIQGMYHFVETLVRYRPDVVRRVVQEEDDVSRNGICKDIFGIIFEKNPANARTLPVELAHMIFNSAFVHEEMKDVVTRPRGTSGKTIFHLAAERGVGHFVGIARQAIFVGMTAEECIGISSLSGTTPLHIVCKGHAYDFESKFAGVASLCGGADNNWSRFTAPVVTRLLLKRDLKENFPFEYAQSARVLEVLYPYLEAENVMRCAGEAILATAVRTHCFDVFEKVVAKMHNGKIGDDDTLLALAAEKRDIVLAIRPRRLLDHLIDKTHPLRIRGATISRLLSLTEELVSARSSDGRIHESDASLIASILEKVRLWSVWKRWRAVKMWVKKRQVVFYWNEAALRERYGPGREEFLESVSVLFRAGDIE